MATIDIPKSQKAAVRVGSGHDAKAPVKDIETQMPDPDQSLVKITWHVFSLMATFFISAMPF